MSAAVGEVLDVVRKVGALPPMPRAAARALELLDDPDAPAERLGKIIETDPSLAAAVLRLVNSAFFALPQPVASIPRAVVMIGFARLRTLILATLTAGLRDLVPPNAADARDRVWEHSISSALAARSLALEFGFGWGEEAFAAGLLHDCGRLVLLAQRTQAYVGVFERAGRSLPSCAEETAAFGVDHATVGAALLTLWNQAPALIESAGLHHAAEFSGTEAGPYIAIVVISDWIARSVTAPVPAKAAERLGVSLDLLDRLALELPPHLAASRAALLSL